MAAVRRGRGQPVVPRKCRAQSWVARWKGVSVGYRLIFPILELQGLAGGRETLCRGRIGCLSTNRENQQSDKDKREDEWGIREEGANHDWRRRCLVSLSRSPFRCPEWRFERNELRFEENETSKLDVPLHSRCLQTGPMPIIAPKLDIVQPLN
jgi:hypothetical protein